MAIEQISTSVFLKLLPSIFQFKILSNVTIFYPPYLMIVKGTWQTLPKNHFKSVFITH
tara:strand:+ start:115229 stop:115402 length:174 start_codon:yes stop_codon:yes gene_type:complete